MVKEHFFVLSINRKSYVISLELVSLGSDSQVTVDPVEVFSLPVYKRAAGVILLHNHPSGTLQPSEEDRDVTDRLIQAGRILKRPVIDHVIISDHSYYSFKDSGLLECIENSLKYVAPYELERQFHDQMQQDIKRFKKEHRIKMRASLQKGMQKGMKIGKEDGKKEGIEEGIIIGKIEGKTEGMQIIAKHMHAAGYKADEIARLTGLSLSEINNLKIN
jgi:DNA repair protein RadC